MEPKKVSGKRSFFYYYFRMFFMPEKTFTELFNDSSKLSFGLIAAMIPALGYMTFYIMASSAGGAPSAFKPWLALPIEKYFTYGIFLSLPGYALALFSSASVLYLLSKLFKGKSSFDDAIAVIGFGAGAATWSTMLHDLADAFMGFTGVIDIRWYEAALNSGTFWDYLYKALMLIYMVWFIMIFYKGIKAANGFNMPKALLTSVLTFMVFQAVLVIFIR